MDYKLIADEVYLHLLLYYNLETKPSYSKLASEIGMSRQTVSKKMKELEEQYLMVIDEDNILQVEYDESLDLIKLCSLKEQGFSAREIAIILYKEEYPAASDSAVKRAIGLSNGTYFNNMIHNIEEKGVSQLEPCIYGIVKEGKIKYIGSTDNFERRRIEHQRKRAFLQNQDFIILKKCSKQERYELEKHFIKMFNPEWNLMSREY